MQTINKIIPSLIGYCLPVLPDIEANIECKEVYSNMQRISESRYFLNQFVQKLPTFVKPGKVIKLIE